MYANVAQKSKNVKTPNLKKKSKKNSTAGVKSVKLSLTKHEIGSNILISPEFTRKYTVKSLFH